MSNDNNNYQINDFLRNMSKKEIKGIAEIVQGQTSVSLLVQSASFSHSTVAGINIKPYISAVCSIMGNKRTCFASLGTNNPIAIGEEISNKDFVRVIVDSKGKANKKIYLHFKEKTTEYSNEDEENDNCLLVYVETKNYAHFCLYEGFLPNKVTELYVKDEKGKLAIRTVALSFLKRTFPELETSYFYGERN
ncbi:hypothetical protein [Paenibacillus sp. FSL L8-0641]|uniref:hypothetical protein n=1 Tax=Paenibacillus sp. FSL L8-0641 TaxID=2921605 RepID=UPI0030F575C2